jgi:hypothetical protein
VVARKPITSSKSKPKAAKPVPAPVRTVTRGVTIAHEEPEEVATYARLKPGQPGKAWKPFGETGWYVDCKDGSRLALLHGSGRVTTLREATPK